MEYYNPEDNRPRRGATIALAIYALVVALLLYKVCFTYDTSRNVNEGIEVEFGDSDLGDGAEEMELNDDAATPTPPVSQAQEQEQENLTDDRSKEEIEQPEVKEPPKEVVSEPVKQPEVRDSVKPKPQVDQKALFPGRKENSTSTSSGEKPGTEGNAGASDGGDEGSPTNSMSGSGGTPVAKVGNRKPISLPKPKTIASSEKNDVIVVVEVQLDEFGKVIKADYTRKGSSPYNKVFFDAAIEAAYKTKFDTSDEVIEQGTITYTFKL